MSLPTYSRYKDSGVEWLGQVPSHWSVHRLKTKLFLLTEKATERNFPVALENIESGTGKFLRTEGEFEGEGVAFDAGDILFGKLRPYLAKVYLTECAGEAVGDFHVLRPAKAMVGRFVQFQILSRAFVDVVDGSTFGSKMPRASWESLGNMPLVVPPVEEQTVIATFLDRETGKIDTLIAEQDKLLTLLAEKRQATISHAVTRGLNPDASMKDSGVAWLREVPEHWAVLPHRRLISRIEQGWSPNAGAEPRGNDEWGVLKISAVKSGRFIEHENKALLDDTVPDESIQVSPGDLLMTRANTPDLVGDCCVVPEGTGSKLMMSDLIYRIKLGAGCNPRFLCYLLLSDFCRAQIQSDARGSSMTMAKISQSLISAWTVVVPPPVEQAAIIAFLDEETAKLDALKAEAERAVTLLKERRSALIAAAVTGKIDVRNAAPQELAA